MTEREEAAHLLAEVNRRKADVRRRLDPTAFVLALAGALTLGFAGVAVFTANLVLEVVTGVAFVAVIGVGLVWRLSQGGRFGRDVNPSFRVGLIAGMVTAAVAFAAVSLRAGHVVIVPTWALALFGAASVAYVASRPAVRRLTPLLATLWAVALIGAVAFPDSLQARRVTTGVAGVVAALGFWVWRRRARRA